MICNYCHEDHATDAICPQMFLAHAQPFVRLNQPNPTSDDHFGSREEMIARYRALEADLVRAKAGWDSALAQAMQNGEKLVAVTEENESLRKDVEALTEALKWYEEDAKEGS